MRLTSNTFLAMSSGAKLNYEDPSGVLCAASSAGDLEKMKQLIDNGIDPNCGRAWHIITATSLDHVIYLEGR